MALPYDGDWHNVSIRHYTLANETSSARNRLLLFEMLAHGVSQILKHFRLLPLLLATSLQNLMVGLYK